MSKAQHTPGPWHVVTCVEDDPTTRYIDDAPGEDGERGYYLAEVEHYDLQELEANARLIAAAPELLEALERIVSINGSTKGAQSLVDEFKHIARAAIAKAKGE